MWQSISKEVYMEKVKGLKPLESYTDPDGILQMSFGKPKIETVWGIRGNSGEDDKPVVKCEMNKESRHDLEWVTEYFEFNS